jgi:hypothetical protein
VRHAVFCSVEVLSNVLGLLLRFGTLNPYFKMFFTRRALFYSTFFFSHLCSLCVISLNLIKEGQKAWLCYLLTLLLFQKSKGEPQVQIAQSRKNHSKQSERWLAKLDG